MERSQQLLPNLLQAILLIGGENIIDVDTWYTLSGEEWRYVVARPDKRKNNVTVCGIHRCLLLAPDECLNGYVFNSGQTSYDAEEWAAAEVAVSVSSQMRTSSKQY